MEEQNGKLQLVYIGLKDDGMPWVTPSVITVRPGARVRFISKYDFSIEFFGRTPFNAQDRVLRKVLRSNSAGLVTVDVSPDYHGAKPLYPKYREYFQKTMGAQCLPDDVEQDVKNDLGDQSLPEKEILHIIKKAPIESDEYIFIYYSVKIGDKEIDPGIGIDPQ